MVFRRPWFRSIAGSAVGILASAGLSVCVVSSTGDITFIGEQEAMAQSSSQLDGDGLVFEIHRLAKAEVYLLRVPAGSDLVVEPVVTNGLAKLPSFAQEPGVLAVINGGFFDPKNQQTASHVIRDGKVLLDPNQNRDLVTNQNVASYMGQILNRSEFRRYDCGGSQRYGIAFHNGAVPGGCDRRDALGGGPQLLPTMTHQQEAFWDVVNGKIVRNPIGMTFPNARSAIGIEADGTVLIAMFAQVPAPANAFPPPAPPAKDGQSISVTLPPANVKPEAPPWRSGVTLKEMTDFLKSQGAVEALNLDGGSSSALYYNGRTYYGRLDKDGQAVQRSVKSVLVVRRRS